jgi:hypothetical protein
MKQFQPPFPPIPIRCLDELLHTEQNHYRCNDPTCPCKAYDTEAMPELWPGALMSIERTTSKKQAVAKASDPVPTNVLPKWPGGTIPDVPPAGQETRPTLQTALSRLATFKVPVVKLRTRIRRKRVLSVLWDIFAVLLFLIVGVLVCGLLIVLAFFVWRFVAQVL